MLFISELFELSEDSTPEPFRQMVKYNHYKLEKFMLLSSMID